MPQAGRGGNPAGGRAAREACLSPAAGAHSAGHDADADGPARPQAVAVCDLRL